MRGRFITLEGVEGTGKSTQIDFIEKFLLDNNKEVLSTREPGGTPVGERVREILLANDLSRMSADTELMLMFAARVEHVKTVIEPALNAGKWVISDRFYDASYAYQGYGRGISLDRIDSLRKLLIGRLEPDLTILLDISLDVSKQRVIERGEQDRFENEDVSFHTKVRNGYLRMALEHKQRICVVDATQTIEQVQIIIKDKLNDLIRNN